MRTYKGRVVYERKEHRFTPKDVARIVAALAENESPAALAEELWGIKTEFVELGILTDEDLYEFAKQLLVMIINWMGIATRGLWDFIHGLFTGETQPDPEPEPEEPDA